MRTSKISISLPITLCAFIDDYQNAHTCSSRSEVIQEALKLLQQQELEHCYRAATKEVEPLFENTIADGLDDETR